MEIPGKVTTSLYIQLGGNGCPVLFKVLESEDVLQSWVQIPEKLMLVVVGRASDLNSLRSFI